MSANRTCWSCTVPRRTTTRPCSTRATTACIAPLVKKGSYKAILGLSGSNLKFTAGTWDPPTQLKEFQAEWSHFRSTMTGAVHPQRRERRADPELPAHAGGQAVHVPDHRSGRNASGPAGDRRRLPVRHRLQAGVPRGGRGSRAGRLPARRREAAGRGWSTARPRTRPSTRTVPSALLTAGVGHAEEHEEHRSGRQLRAEEGHLLRHVQRREPR